MQSNCKELIGVIPNEIEVESTVMLPEVEDTTKILRIKWLIKDDKFIFVAKSPKLNAKVTKRKISNWINFF